MKRREFLNTLTGLGLASALPACSDNPQTPVQSIIPSSVVPSSAIPKRFIPGTDEALPIVGLGSTKAVRRIPEQGPDEITRLIQTLREHGGNVIDTSIRTGDLDRPFGQILQDERWSNDLFISTKIKTEGKQAGIDQKMQTQRLFDRRPADLIQVEDMLDFDSHLESLLEWKEQGDTRYIGITTSDTEDHARMEAYMNTAPIDFIQVNYSIPEYHSEQRILPLAEDKGIAVLINSPFNNGEWFQITQGKPLPEWAAEFDCTSWAQFGLKYILPHPAITCVLTETTRPEHLIENMNSSFDPFPDSEMRNRMKSHVLSLI